MTGRRVASSLSRGVADDPPRLPACAVPAERAADVAFAGQVDDRTADYILKVRDSFERMNDATTQLAALLVVAAAGGHDQRGHAVLDHVRRNLAEARDGLDAALPTRRADHHHAHLQAAADALARTLDLADRPATWTDRIETGLALAALRRAGHHLRWAAASLPGFETVVLGEGCGCCGPAGVPGGTR